MDFSVHCSAIVGLHIRRTNVQPNPACLWAQTSRNLIVLVAFVRDSAGPGEDVWLRASCVSPSDGSVGFFQLFIEADLLLLTQRMREIQPTLVK